MMFLRKAFHNPIITKHMGAEAEWYASLIKPTWAPPEWLFGPAWTVLYVIIAISFAYVGIRYWKGQIGFMVLLPFILNLVFNLAFTPIQFGLRNNWLAAIDIILVWVTLVWALAAIRSHIPWVAYANLPYFLWVSFASVLQISITWLNRL
ncbi:MAG: TspO/MBR family protein [Candidatus Moraniibacteriota bacterium]